MADVHLPVGPYDVGRVWKYFAFVVGEFGLDAVLEDFRLAGRPDYSHYFRETPEPGRDENRAIVQMTILERILPRLDARQQMRLAPVLASRTPAAPVANPRVAAAERYSKRALQVVLDAGQLGHDLSSRCDFDRATDRTIDCPPANRTATEPRPRQAG